MVLDKISKMLLKPIDHLEIPKNEADKINKLNQTYSRSALKILLIAKEKEGNVQRILKYDVTTYNYLFDGEMMTKPDKAKIVTELKELISTGDRDFSHKPVLNQKTGFVVVDFMSFIRSQKKVLADDTIHEQSTFRSFLNVNIV